MADFFKDSEEMSEEDDIITLYNESTGEDEDFNHLATLDYKEKWYIFLQPVVTPEDMEEDELLIYEIAEGEDGNDMFLPIEDEKLLEEVFNEFLKALDEEEAE